jgi:hypothetical protein
VALGSDDKLSSWPHAAREKLTINKWQYHKKVRLGFVRRPGRGTFKKAHAGVFPWARR